MAILRHRGSTLYLFAPYSEREKCKSIKGGSWNKEHKCWMYPFACLEAIRGMFPGISLPDTIDQYVQLKEAEKVKLQSVRLDGVADDEEHPFLMKHQVYGKQIAKNRKKFAYFYDTGTGKTIMALSICESNPMPTLVICPLTIIKTAWMDDATNFFPNLKLTSLHFERDRNHVRLNKALNTKSDIYIVNFESFKTLFDTIKQLGIKRVFIDESSKMKDEASQITKDLLQQSKLTEYFYIMSGTPAPNNELEYWAQIESVSPGLLGPSFYSFRARFFERSKDNRYQYYMNPAMREEFIRLLATCSVYVSKDDCLDLPPHTFQAVDVEMTPEQRRIYKQMERDQFAMIDESTLVLTPNKLASIMKLRQITAGFIFDEEKKVNPLSDAKIKAMYEELESYGDNQCIIWIQFRPEVDMVRAAIAKKYGPESVRALYGGTTKSDGDIEKEDDENIKDAVIREFKTGKIKYLICHPRTAMYGLTFVNAKYALYYSMSHSYEEFHQSRDRLVRKGQTQNCTFRYLTCTGTIDKAVYQSVKRKKTTSEEILHYIRVMKGGGEYELDTDDKTENL